MINEIFKLQNSWRNNPDYEFNLKKREILPIIINNIDNKNILGITGSRQVGKSSLLYLVIEYLINSKSNPRNIFYFNLDDLKLRELFTNLPDFIHFIGAESNNIKNLKDKKKYILIDEIQRLENPGLILKELYDLNLNIKIIYSGSSQLEIKSKLKEYLVGRARQLDIHRLSFTEYIQFNRPITKKQALYDMLIYGSYPAIAIESNKTEKKLSLKDIFQSYIEKDLVDFLKIDNISAFNNMLIMLANQTGSLMNVENLSKSLRISRKEVDKYISILENTYIIKRIYPFYKNYKKEITKTPKIYFMDPGLRNLIINNFNDPLMRDDIGKLFENFHLLELLKNDFYSNNKINFWRTTNQTEIDFIIHGNDIQEAVEVKWNKKTRPKSFITFNKYYPEMKTKVITNENYI